MNQFILKLLLGLSIFSQIWPPIWPSNDFLFSVVIERSTAKRLKKLIHAKTLQARRYAQFEAMFRQTFQNHTLLLRFYAYGCYCLNLGDRPLAGIMTGMEPADLLDA